MVLGVTGGVASGKSAFVAALMEVAGPLGAAQFSADAVARDLLAPGTSMTREVLTHFGPEIRLSDSEVDAVDRAKLALRIFSHPRDRRWLEHLMHPVIIERLRADTGPYLGKPISARGVDSGESVCLAIAEIPLLYEANLTDMVDAVAVTICKEQTQAARIRERRPGTSDADAHAQIQSQISISKKARRADYVIDAEGSLTDLARQARGLFDRLTGAGV